MIFEIAGMQNCSTVDYPGKIADVIFTSGCNMNCFYCHNNQIITNDSNMVIDNDEVLKRLRKHSGLIDAVVISGGEPTLQSGLKDFIKHVRGIGYLVKLDTNGTNPKILSDLINERLLDYVAMDIKAQPQRYNELCGCEVNVNDINESIEILLQDKVDYEFRTTVPTQLELEDLLNIAQWINGAKRYYLQQYKEEEEIEYSKHQEKEMLYFAKKVRKILGHCECRGISTKS